MCTVPIRPCAVSLLPRLHHRLSPLVTHSSYIRSPNLSPAPSPIFPYMTLAHLVTCYTCRSHVTRALPGSLQIHRANPPALQDKLSPRLLPPILALSVSRPYASIFFMICYILFCKLSPTCFVPCLLDYCATCKCS